MEHDAGTPIAGTITVCAQADADDIDNMDTMPLANSTGAENKDEDTASVDSGFFECMSVLDSESAN